MQRAEWKLTFKAITRSPEIADRLVALIDDYARRALWSWEETAELTKRDLLNGKSLAVIYEGLTIEETHAP